MQNSTGIGGFSLAKDEQVSSDFDHFHPVEIENGTEHGKTHYFRPLSSSKNGPYSFEIQQDPDLMLSPKTMRLYGAMRIKLRETKDDGTEEEKNLPAGFNVSTVNNVFHSLFSAVPIAINGTIITDPSALWYAYKAYDEITLSYSPSVKRKHFKQRGYIADTHSQFDTLGNGNKGYTERKDMFAESKWVYFGIKVHSDVCTIQNYLPVGQKLEIEFHRNPDDFVLLYPAVQNKSCFIELKDLELGIRKASPAQSIRNYYNEKLNEGAKPSVPIDRSIIINYAVPAQTSDLSHYNLIRGTNCLPDQIIISMVKSSAWKGDHTQNPFNFQHFNVCEASLRVNGINEPERSYKLEPAGENKVRAYEEFLENVGVGTENRNIGIDIDDYYGGYFFLAWDRSPDKCNRRHSCKQVLR